MKLFPTIGIEMHAELKSNSKAFSTAENTYTKHSNNHVSPVDLGLPGILPVVNLEPVKKGIKMATILNCEIPEYLYYDRKNYYYPDLPKGYQITQSHAPIGINGHIEVPFNGETKEFLIHDIHLEEDSAKMEHLTSESLINYNRSGIPLLELVTEPTFHSKEEVMAFLEYIRRVYQYTDISEADIRKGQIRCDVNISLSTDENTLGTKVEIKNVNGFANVEKVIDAEIARQTKLFEDGRESEIEQETRRYDEASNTTIRMRSKADAIDYKYFIEPNIPKMKITKELINDSIKDIPKLPLERINYYKSLGLTEEDYNPIIKDRLLSDYVNEVLESKADAKLAINFITANIISFINRNEISINELRVKPSDIILVLSKMSDNSISSKQAKEVVEKLLTTDSDINSIISEYSQNSNEDELATLISNIISNSPNEVEAYKNGRTNLFNFFVGQVMKETKGKANPVLTKELIEKELSK